VPDGRPGDPPANDTEAAQKDVPGVTTSFSLPVVKVSGNGKIYLGAKLTGKVTTTVPEKMSATADVNECNQTPAEIITKNLTVSGVSDHVFEYSIQLGTAVYDFKEQQRTPIGAEASAFIQWRW